MLYEPDGYAFREVLVERFEAIEPELLVLDYVVLAPDWRGLKLGLLAVHRMVDLLGGGCGPGGEVRLVGPILAVLPTSSSSSDIKAHISLISLHSSLSHWRGKSASATIVSWVSFVVKVGHHRVDRFSHRAPLSTRRRLMRWLIRWLPNRRLKKDRPSARPTPTTPSRSNRTRLRGSPTGRTAPIRRTSPTSPSGATRRMGRTASRKSRVSAPRASRSHSII